MRYVWWQCDMDDLTASARVSASADPWFFDIVHKLVPLETNRLTKEKHTKSPSRNQSSN